MKSRGLAWLLALCLLLTLLPATALAQEEGEFPAETTEGISEETSTPGEEVVPEESDLPADPPEAESSTAPPEELPAEDTGDPADPPLPEEEVLPDEEASLQDPAAEEECPAAEEIPSAEGPDVALQESVLSGYCGGEGDGTNLSWELSSEEGEHYVLTISGSGRMVDYASAYATPWANYRNRIYDLRLSDDITYIGNYSFYRMFKYSTEPSRLPSVAVKGTGRFEKLTLPKNLKEIGAHAFGGIGLVGEIVLPEGLEIIGDSAFLGCGGVIYNQYGSCLEDFSDGLTNNPSIPDSTINIPSTVTYIGAHAFESAKFTNEIRIPLATWRNGLGDMAFAYSKFTGSLIVPEGVTEVTGDSPFSLTDFTSLSLPSTLKHVGDHSFSGLENITELVLPEGLETVGEYAFSRCGATNVLKIPESMTIVGGKWAFSSGKYTGVQLHDGIKELAHGVFAYCSSITEVKIPDSVEIMGPTVFGDTGLLRQPAWPENLISAGGSIYSGCENMTGTGTFPAGIGYTGTNLFRGTALTSIEVAYDMTSIPADSMITSENLQSIRIPASVTTIGARATYKCTSLKYIYFEGTQEQWDSIKVLANNTPFNNAKVLFVNPSISTTKNPSNYNGTTVQRMIRAMVPGNEVYPQPGGFHMLVKDRSGNTLYNDSTGTKNYVDLRLNPDSGASVTISKSGYHTYTLPEELVAMSTIVSIYPTSWEGPFAQAILADNSTENFKSYTNLLFQSHTIYVQDTHYLNETIYVDVNWNGYRPGSIYLQQAGETFKMPLSQGRNTGLNLSTSFVLKRPTFLVMETADGQIFKQQVKLTFLEANNTVRADLGQQVNINRFDRAYNGKNLDVVGGHTLAFNFANVLKNKMEIAIEVKSDGTMQGTIGLKLGSKQHVGEVVGSVKDAISEMHRNYLDDISGGFNNLGPNTTKLLQNARKNGMLPEGTSSSVGIDGKVQLIGYFEGKVDFATGAKVLQKTEIAILFGGQVSMTQVYYSSVLPKYVTAALEASVKAALQFAEGEDGFLEIQQALQLTTTIQIGLEGGIGHPKVISGGLWATGALTVKSYIPNDPEQNLWLLNAKGGLAGSIGNVESSSKFELWDTDNLVLYQNGEPLPNGFNTVSLLGEAEEWHSVSRDYLDHPAGSADLLGEVPENTVSTSVIDASNYPYSVPQALNVNGDLHVYRLKDGGEARSDINRTVLTWSNETTDDEAIVWPGSETADYGAVVLEDEGGTHMVWSKAGKVLSDSETNLEDVSANMDLAYAYLPAGSDTFTNQTMIVTMDGMDMMPAITKTASGLKVAFVHSDNGPFAQTQDLYIISYDGTTWGEPRRVPAAIGAVDQLTWSTDDWVYFSYWTEKKNGDDEMIPVSKLDRADGSSYGMLGENASKPIQAGGKVWWYADGALMSVTGYANPVGEGPAVAGSDWFLPVENVDGTVTTVLFHSHDQAGNSVISASFYDEEWCEPIPVLEAGCILTDISAAAFAGNVIEILASRITLDEDYRAVSGDLMRYTMTVGANAAITDLTYEGTSMDPDGTLEILAAVENHGASDLGVFSVEVKDGDTLLESSLIHQDILRGETGYLEITCALPDTLPEDLIVTVMPLDSPDIYPEDNSAVLTLKRSDLSVETVYSEVISDNGTAETTVQVVNRGQTTMSGMTLELRVASQDGTVIGSTVIPALTPDEVALLTLETSAGLLNAGDLVYAVIPMTDAQLAKENIEYNNAGFAQVQSLRPVALGDTCETYFSVEETGDVVQVVLDIANYSDEAVTGTYCAALYQGGKCLEVGAACQIATNINEAENLAAFTFDAPNGTAEVRVFLLDEQFRPAGEVWSQTISGT